jgi:hypothetical protein
MQTPTASLKTNVWVASVGESDYEAITRPLEHFDATAVEARQAAVFAGAFARQTLDRVGAERPADTTCDVCQCTSF